MLYRIENEQLLPIPEREACLEEYKPAIGVYTPAEFQGLSDFFSVSTKMMQQWKTGPSSWYESGEQVNYFSLSLSPYDPGDDPTHHALMVYRHDLLLLVCEDTEKILDLLHPLPAGNIPDSGPVLLRLLEHLVVNDHGLLEMIEEDISDLENSLLLGKRDNVEEIITLRKQLLGWKRYYEGMLWILDDIQENENGLLDDTTIRQFHIHSNRVDRLFHSVLNLRDYVTQVRESYQAEMDLRLNNIMKIFTVITAVFLPLTLLVGWYGMNLKMPEYNWTFGYPFVAGLSIVILATCVIFFLRNKWFR